jgi:hypothetical protein
MDSSYRRGCYHSLEALGCQRQQVIVQSDIPGTWRLGYECRILWHQ